MTFKIIPDNFRPNVSAADLSTGSVATGYDFDDTLRKSRGRRWRSAPTVDEIVGYHQAAASQSVDTCILTEAHKLITQSGVELQVGYNNTGAAELVALQTFNLLAASDLVGPYAQDLVVTFDAVTALRCGFQADITGVNGTPIGLLLTLTRL